MGERLFRDFANVWTPVAPVRTDAVTLRFRKSYFSRVKDSSSVPPEPQPVRTAATSCA
jgi:hypothetical protein